MANKQTLENYLIQLGERFEQIGENMWKINDEYDNIDDIIIFYADSIVIFRVKLFDLTQIKESVKKEDLYRFMLELNAYDLTHGAYGIEGDSVIIVDTLETENLDYNEFEASVNALALEITDRYPIFKSKFLK